ncbi:MAG: glycosyltransferase family 4 protein [Myxococcota bacterium]
MPSRERVEGAPPALAVVTADFPPVVGGIATYAAELSRRLLRTHAVTVVAPAHPRSAHHDRTFPAPVVRLPGGADALGFASLPALLRRRPTTVLCATWGVAPSAIVARRLGRVKRVVVAAHGRELLLEPWPGRAQRGYDVFRRRVLRHADHCLPVSRYTAGLLEALGVAARRITVVSNGTDPDRFVRPPYPASPYPASPSPLRGLGAGGGPIVLTVARLVRRKGVDTVLEAWPTIAAHHPGARYVVVGDGPDRARLEALARPLGPGIHFAGNVDEDELGAWYRACDVFVMPARSEPPDVEGFGLVFLEAGALGKPVVAARAGGVVDAVDDEKTGLLVPPGDPVTTAAAVVRILADPSLAARLGAGGRARATASRWEDVAGAMVRVL